MKPKQEEALRDYLRESIVPLIEDVLTKKLGQAITFAKEELAAPDLQDELDATNRQVEILSDALAESRREVAKLKELNT